MRVVVILICLLGLGLLAPAQNLVPNPSFESYSSLPNGYGQWTKCLNWNNVNMWPNFQWPYASPDYLHTSGSGGSQLPNSTFGTVTPYNGNAVMSGVSWYTTSNFREYIACQLTSPMTVGQPYDVTIHVTNGTSSFAYGIYGPQIAFSVNALNQTNHEPINYTPQLVPSSIIYSTGWTTLSYNFTPTQPFQHMTMGNFYNDANTIRQALGGGGSGAYYFFDGMSVTQSVVLNQTRITLSGQTSEKTNLLEWQQDGEPTAFSIWRSKDGQQFMKIGSTEAGGNESFRDGAPFYGKNWYKVRIDHLDGSVSWSNVVLLENTSENELNIFSIFPNPASSQVFIQLEHPSVDEISVKMFDATGRMVREKSMATYGQRMSTFELPVSDLAAGIYQVRVQAGSTFATKPVVVQGN